MEWNNIVSRVRVYDFEESVRASKLAMAADPGKLTNTMYDRQIKLAQAPAGSGHDHWLVGVRVSFDLKYTIKAWTEAERYRFFDLITSQSTMHRITKLGASDSNYISYTDRRVIAVVEDLIKKYNDDPTPENYLHLLYSVPVGLQLTCRISTNYLQLKTIYNQRKDHRLPEWRAFCEWICTLPHSYLITGVPND